MKKLKIMFLLLPILAMTGCSSTSNSNFVPEGTKLTKDVSGEMSKTLDELCVDATNEVVKKTENNKFSLKTIKKFSDEEITINHYDWQYDDKENFCHVYFDLENPENIVISGFSTLKIDVKQRVKNDKKSLTDLYNSDRFIDFQDTYIVSSELSKKIKKGFYTIYEKKEGKYIFKKVVLRENEEEYKIVENLYKKEKYISNKYEENILNEVNK